MHSISWLSQVCNFCCKLFGTQLNQLGCELLFYICAVATVGYGDISPTTVPSKVVVIIFIVTSLVVIPMQVNKLTTRCFEIRMFRIQLATSRILSFVVMYLIGEEWKEFSENSSILIDRRLIPLTSM